MEIKAWLAYLERESVARKGRLKAYFIYGNDDRYTKEARTLELEQIGGATSCVTA